ncbi:kinase-like domain-containing protein [Cryomyces antarcticus]
MGTIALPSARADSPQAVRHIHLSYDNANSETSALKLILALEPGWEHSEGKIEFVRFTDGITNTLLKAVKRRPGCSEQQIDQESILLRAYGKGTDILIDRERETLSHSLLASKDLAPPLLARFDNGLMYKFIEGIVCAPEDLRRQEVWRGVAKRLGEWHARLPISAISSEPSLHKPMTNGCTNGIDKSGEDITPDKSVPNVWTVMQKWIYALPAGTEAERLRQQSLQNELERSVKELGDTPGIGGCGYVFSHCDLLSGNVIIQPSTAAKPSDPTTSECTVSFIDYEYATPAPAAFDIANHFAEWGGFDCDFGVLPTRSQRRDFLTHYLAAYKAHLAAADRAAVSSDAAERLFADIDVFRGMPGFYWGIWALIQATISQIDFDYASYAEVRLSEYWAWRAETEGSRARGGEEMPVRERRWAQEE